MNSPRFSATWLGLVLCLTWGASSLHAQEPHETQVGREPVSLQDSPDLSSMGEADLENTRAKRLDILKDQNTSTTLALDPYGGWVNAPASFGTPKPGKFFRVAKLGGAWWFVTPDGHPFVSKGVTDVNWFGAVLSPGPFHDLLVQKYGDEATWAAAAAARVRDWGFNTIGPWSSASIEAEMTHSPVILDMGGGNGPRHPDAVVTDYWDPAFADHAAKMVSERAAPHVDDPKLLGYFLDNEVVWGADHFRTKQSLLQLYLAFPEGAPGRTEALRHLRASADTVGQFNAIWQTGIEAWDELPALSPRKLRPRTPESETVTEKFMLAVFEQYATTAIEALHAVDRNHLILGCRFHTYPGDALLRASAKYFDVISMAFYEARPPVEEIDAMANEVDKPILIEEWTFKAHDSGIKNPWGIYAPEVRTQTERCLAYENYVQRFMSRPYGIGYHWYKWMDNPTLPDERFSGDNCGLLNQNDEPYAAFVAYVREINRRVEIWHAQGAERSS